MKIPIAASVWASITSVGIFNVSGFNKVAPGGRVLTKKQMKAKPHIAAILLAALLSILALAASGETAILIQSPANYTTLDSNTVTFQYNASGASGINISSCALIVNSTVKNTTSQPAANQILGFASAMAEGSYAWRINCTDASGTNLSQQYYLNVDTTKPAISVTEPSDKMKTSNRTISFRFNPTDSFLKNCSLYTNQTTTWLPNQTSQAASGQQNSFTAAFSDGSYSWAIRCNDSIYEQWSSNYTITIDSTPPSVVSYMPAASTKPGITLNVTTNENATCRYSASSNTSYDSMQAMSTTGTTEHSTALESLADGTHQYYIRCSDYMRNNMSSDYVATVSIQLPPAADIILSDPSPVKPGIIELSVLTSRAMASSPQLSYSLNDFPGIIRQIPLSSSGYSSLWKGYMVAEDTGTKKIGTFYFTGTDTRGVTGTEITNGKNFILDSEKPKEPISIKAYSEPDGVIKLNWYYEDVDVDYYNIYRATASGVDFTDLYASTNSTAYTDTAVSDKTTYFYRVNVVDKAGNKGALSGEIYATSVSKNSTAAETKQDVPKVLPPNLVPKVNAAITKTENAAIDVNAAITNLKAKASQSQDEKDIIKKLRLIEKAEDAKVQLDGAIIKLEGMKSSYATEPELDSRIGAITSEISIIKKTVASTIKLTETSKSIQAVTKGDISSAIELVLPSLKKEEKEAYAEQAYREQQAIKIESKIAALTIEYLDGSKSDKTIIEKIFSRQSPETLQELVIVETIPKSIAEDTASIEFMTEDYEILKSDPIIKWGILELGLEEKSIQYSVNRLVDINDAKAAKSVPLPNLNKIGQESKKITGFSIMATIQQAAGLGKTGTLFAIIGVSAIAVMFVYYRGFAKPGTGEASEETYEDYVIMRNMLKDAQSCINEGQMAEAENLYAQMQEAYSSLPKKLKTRIYGECLKLQSSISRHKNKSH